MIPNIPEPSIPIDHGYLSPADSKAIEDYTTTLRGGFFYGVDLYGKIGTVAAGDREVAPGYHFALNKYPFYRIVFTISGKATIKIENNLYAAGAGSIYYFVPKQSSTILNDSDEPWRHIYVHFTGTEVSEWLEKTLAISDHVVQITKPIEMQYLFEHIVNQCVNQHEDSQAISDSLLKTILIMLPSSILYNPKHISPARMTYLECYNYIKNNFCEIKTINDIADNCFIDKAYLCRLFKRYANISPMAYVTKLKMSKAALLLIQTDYSIKKISIILNFEDPFHFSHVFKKLYSVSPRHYRETL